jgi:hypothetical protein
MLGRLRLDSETARKPIIEKKVGRDTPLAERQAARAGQKIRIVKANQDKAHDSLRIKLVE